MVYQNLITVNNFQYIEKKSDSKIPQQVKDYSGSYKDRERTRLDISEDMLPF